LINLTQSLAVEWAPHVRVNAIVAGIVRTEQAEVHYGDADGQARVAATIPMGRLLDPSDIADACLFLASPQAAMITGAALQVHGGGERPAFLDAAAAAPA
jgi:NAD(P)-dependent dehydrogenase (short-subunit alcohol dehydrogenase family)